MPAYLTLAILASMMVLGCAQMNVLEPEELASRYSDIYISPFRKHMSAQTGNFTGELRIFDRDAVSKYCHKSLSDHEKNQLAAEFGEKGVIVVLPTYYDIGCFNNDSRYSNYDYFADWCHINRAFVFAKEFIPGLYYNNNDGLYFHNFKSKYPHVRGCFGVQIKENPETAELWDRVLNGTRVVANIKPQESQCEPLFQGVLCTILYRLILGGGCIFTSLYSLMGLMSPSRIRKENQRLNTIVLGSNFITMAAIGFTLVQGGWRLSPDVSETTNSFMNTLFFGSSTATDYLIACRWFQIKRNTHLKFREQFKEKTATTGEKALVVLAVFISMILIFADWYVAILFINASREHEWFILVFVPTMSAILQLIVIGFLSYQVWCMIKILQRMQACLTQSMMSKGKLETFTNQQKTIAHLKKWVSVSVISALATLIVLVLIAKTSIIYSSCEGYVLLWAIFILCKIGNIASQNAVCVPKMQKVRQAVSPSEVDHLQIM